jgi:hypothetical protein
MAYTTTVNPNPPLQAPTIDIGGKVIYKAGTWGSKYPARRMMLTLRMTDTTGTTTSVGSGSTDLNGNFKIRSGFIANAFSRITLEVSDMTTDDTYSHTLYPGLVGPNGGFQNIKEVEFPFAPPHPELARINSLPFLDVQKLVKQLSDIVRSPNYPLTIELTSEWRAIAPKIPIGDMSDEPTSRIIEVNGRKLDKPVPIKVPDDVLSQRRQQARKLRETQKKYDRNIPVITPAQKLLHMLSGADFTKELSQRITEKIFIHGIVPGKAGAPAESIVTILDGLSRVTLKQMETETILKRLVLALQRAARMPFYFDSVMEEAAADMVAASVLICLAGLAARDKAKPKISIDYSFFFPAIGGVDDLRPYVKLTILVVKN